MKQPKMAAPPPPPTDNDADQARRDEMERQARLRRAQGASSAGGDASPLTAAAKSILGS